MKLAIITGVSRGLGKALAQTFLNNHWQVWGIGRQADIKHDQFSFINCDVADPEQISRLVFDLNGFNEIVLINNAGILGPVMPLRDQQVTEEQRVFQINVLAPIQLCRMVLQATPSDAQLTIINISSGAARRPITSWSLYGASKAALDHFSTILQEEEREAGRSTRIYALAPGVIDTDMQREIRQSDAQHFTAHNQFVKLHQEGQLKSAIQTASEVYGLILLPGNEVLTRL